MYAYMPGHQLTLDVGESTSKLVNWSLANWHVGETTVIPVLAKCVMIKKYTKLHLCVDIYTVLGKCLLFKSYAKPLLLLTAFIIFLKRSY